MPTYTFKRKSTGEEWTEFMTMSAREELLKDADVTQLIVSAPVLGYNVVTGKPSDAFRDKLREIKKSNPRSTINTF